LINKKIVLHKVHNINECMIMLLLIYFLGGNNMWFRSGWKPKQNIQL